MKVRYSDTAATELEEISDYIAQFNRLAARDVLARVERAVGNLAEFPELAQTTDEPGVRRMPVGRFPLMIFYTIGKDEIVILHVRHTARDTPSLLGER
jgi:toxin ParE1/3/4